MFGWLSHLLPTPVKECVHVWNIIYVHRHILIAKERRCAKRGMEQVVAWKNKNAVDVHADRMLKCK